MKRTVVDKQGFRHLLLCRVIMGKLEAVPAGSDQRRPSSEEYDSGVDSFSSPNEFIVWSNKINTHVLPEYVLSFKLASDKGSVYLCVVVVICCVFVIRDDVSDLFFVWFCRT